MYPDKSPETIIGPQDQNGSFITASLVKANRKNKYNTTKLEIIIPAFTIRLGVGLDFSPPFNPKYPEM